MSLKHILALSHAHKPIEDMTRLSLDCVQDHALPVDIYRQMALDAYEGEQRLNHTASNREHVWRLLQGGELIAPVPPLPPRETPPEMAAALALGTPPPSGRTEPVSETQAPNGEAAPQPPVKKTRARKKAEAPKPTPESGSMVQAESGETPLAAPPRRGRKKKTAGEAGAPVETEVKTSPTSNGNAPQASTDPETGVPPAKPKRTRRVGEPKPIRYPVGEPEIEQGT